MSDAFSRRQPIDPDCGDHPARHSIASMRIKPCRIRIGAIAAPINRFNSHLPQNRRGQTAEVSKIVPRLFIAGFEVNLPVRQCPFAASQLGSGQWCLGEQRFVRQKNIHTHFKMSRPYCRTEIHHQIVRRTIETAHGVP